MTAMILPASSVTKPCRTCQNRNTWTQANKVLVIDEQVICGNCGNELERHQENEMPYEVASIVRSLIQHGLFQLNDGISSYTIGDNKAKSKANAIELDRFESSLSFARCTIQWCDFERDRSKEERPRQEYQRKKVACYVPESIDQTATLISNSSGSCYNAMNLTEIAASSERKTMRFERYCKLSSFGNVLDPFKHLRIRVEISWKFPDDHGQIFIPVVEADLAMKILRDGLNMLEASELGSIKFFIDRGQAERRAVALATDAAKPAHLLTYRCNHYAASAALRHDLKLASDKPDIPTRLIAFQDHCKGNRGIAIGQALVEYLRHTHRRDVHMELFTANTP
ncbi:MAG: hypothetical protein K2W82_11310 [Candidatus Obscuribacterales bacterium]|nr:hypothetical protein [Candidatus Obscuribacterales bacterium]